MLTLSNARHEAFSQLLAQGYTPAFAYREAGFDSRNAKARAARLAKRPNIRARVKVLISSLPRIQDLQARFAPSALLMPETKEQMAALLWQITSGMRTILPVQFRAASLLCRLKGWHLNPRSLRATATPGCPQPKSETHSTSAETTRLTPTEQTLITTLAQQVIAADLAQKPLESHLAQAFLASMTDTLLTATNDSSDQPAPSDPSVSSVSSVSPDTTPPDDFLEYYNRIQAIAQIIRQARGEQAVASPSNPPNIPISSTLQAVDPQALNSESPKTKVISRTKSDHCGWPEVESPNASSNSKTFSELLSSLYNAPRHHPSSSSPTDPTPAVTTPSSRPSKPPRDNWSPAFARSLRA